VVSYAKDSKASSEDQRTADFNHFVIFDPRVRAAAGRAPWCCPPPAAATSDGEAAGALSVPACRAPAALLPQNLLACHDFQYIDLKPDDKNISCHARYRNTSGVDTVSCRGPGAWGTRPQH
jgi:hypothetical protein